MRRPIFIVAAIALLSSGVDAIQIQPLHQAVSKLELTDRQREDIRKLSTVYLRAVSELTLKQQQHELAMVADHDSVDRISAIIRLHAQQLSTFVSYKNRLLRVLSPTQRAEVIACLQRRSGGSLASQSDGPKTVAF